MKQLFLLAVCYFSFAVHGKSQQNIPVSDTIKVILENDKVKVTEYVSNPGKDICGKGNIHMLLIILFCLPMRRQQ